jgi:Fe2+ transport system protein B
MNNLLRKASPLMKNLHNFKYNNKKVLLKYLSLAPNFSAKFRLVKSHSESLRNYFPKVDKEQIKKESSKTQLDIKNMKYPLIINSPLIAGISIVLFQSVLVGGEFPELLRFIFKSTFIYGSIFTGMNLGIRVQLDDKITSVNYNDIKKKFIMLGGVLGISQTLGAVVMPLPLFIGLYAALYALMTSIMNNIHEEVDDLVNKTKIIMMLIAFLNLIFICLTYNDFKESIKYAESFDKLVDDFLSVTDERFDAELVDKEKCLRAVDYRLFKINKSDI